MNHPRIWRCKSILRIEIATVGRRITSSKRVLPVPSFERPCSFFPFRRSPSADDPPRCDSMPGVEALAVPAQDILRRGEGMKAGEGEGGWCLLGGRKSTCSRNSPFSESPSVVRPGAPKSDARSPVRSVLAPFRRAAWLGLARLPGRFPALCLRAMPGTCWGPQQHGSEGRIVCSRLEKASCLVDLPGWSSVRVPSPKIPPWAESPRDSQSSNGRGE